MSKKLIKKILREQIEHEDKLYGLFKKIYFKNFDENIEHAAQIFIDASRRDYYLSSGRVIQTGDECITQPYCFCHFVKDMINWTEDMLKNRSTIIATLDKDFTDEKKKNEFIFDLPPYNFMQYGFTGYESMYLYGRLFRELREKNKC